MLLFEHYVMMFGYVNCCVRELVILARTWFAFGLPSETGCDSGLVENSLVGFGGLDDNLIKGLTCVLSVEQMLNAQFTGFNISEQV
jgi:hypothetical protein